MLEALSISKRFGATLALSGVSFMAEPGEIHVLLGENGAGKSTLMSVLAGRIRPDAGTVTLYGSPVRTGSPQAAIAAGIGAVHQSSTLFERMTWEENLALGGFGLGSRLLDMRAIVQKAAQLADELRFPLPPPGTRIEDRSVTDRVRVEVLRALSFGPRVLILDEPTSVLAPAELEGFLDSIRQLRARGRILILITHKLGEAMAIADRITVLRHGRVVAQTTPRETSETALAGMMVGDLPLASAPSKVREVGEVVLEARDLSLEDRDRAILDRLSFTVNRGEIVGIAGVDGNGQAELIDVVAGLRAPTSGTIFVSGVASNGSGAGVAVIPQDRDRDGLILTMRLWENL
ncbi:MAG TPA: ATP-binding cassette domain-containing protein, partial [Candidatus Binataceae bacterium]